MKLNVLYVTSEVHPFSKSGGLADVAGALPPALAREGAQVTVISPWYQELRGEKQPRLIATVRTPLGVSWRIGRLLHDGVEQLFLGHSGFDRAGYYGHSDDVERFARFCEAVPHAAAAVGVRPDIVHINDWQAGLVAPIMRLTRVPPSQLQAKIIYTIHNIQYQGRWNPRDVLAWTGLPQSEVHPGGLEFFNDINSAKAGLVYSDAVTTVSPTYALEVQTPEMGYNLDGVLRYKGVTGILNGLDTNYWNPAIDPMLEHNYSDFAGKASSQAALRQRYHMDSERPVLAMVTRLADQKGMDLAMAALPRIVREWNLLVLGSGDPGFSGPLEALHDLVPERVVFEKGFNEALAHQIYAGSDAFLMPSRFEPCGLSQMIAMRYGTVPIVRRTGGLADTVPESRGYGFRDYKADALDATLARARSEWQSSNWAKRATEGMKADWSWNVSVRDHLKLYQWLIKG
jgi:starch synthase